MAREFGLPPVFHGVKFWLRLGAVGFFGIGAILAGPTMWAQFVTHDRIGVEVVDRSAAGHPIVAIPEGEGSRRVEVPALAAARVGDHVEVFQGRADRGDIRVYDVDRAYIILVICAGIGWFAWSTGRSIDNADELAAADQKAQAGIGEQFVVESRELDGSTGLLRVVAAGRTPPATPLNRQADAMVESLGGSSTAIGVTIFTWAFFCFLALGFDGVFQGRGLSIGGIVAIVAATAMAAAVASFRHRIVLSNSDRAIYKDTAILGLHRRSARPLDDFNAVTLRHERGRVRSSSGNRHATRLVHRFRVELCGPERFVLATFTDPFRARRRARQLADYLGLPLAEPTIDNPASVSLYEG